MKPTTTLASAVAPDGAIIELQEHDGEFYLRINGTALMSTRAVASEQKLAELACERIAEAEKSAGRVLIGGLGFGFSLRRALEILGPHGMIEVAELLPEIVQWNRNYLRDVNGELLDDARVKIYQKDVYNLFQASGGERRYDAILLDVDNSPDPLVQNDNARIYSPAGLAMIRNALVPGGRAVFWSGNSDRFFERELRLVFARAESVPARAYPEAKHFAHMLFVAERD